LFYGLKIAVFFLLYESFSKKKKSHPHRRLKHVVKGKKGAAQRGAPGAVIKSHLPIKIMAAFRERERERETERKRSRATDREFGVKT
jgi:hypothetical protein